MPLLPSLINLAIPAYVFPGDPEDVALLGADPPPGPVVMNNNSGLTPMTGDWLEQADDFRGAGIRVLGYVNTWDYGLGQPLSSGAIETAIDGVLVNGDGILHFDGVFLDGHPRDTGPGGSGDSTWLTQYFALYAYIRTTAAGINPDRVVTVAANAGTAVADEYLATGCSDIMCTFEGSEAAYSASWLGGNVFSYGTGLYRLGTEFTRSHFWHLIYSSAGEAQMRADVLAAFGRHAGWVYVTDAGLPNPWDVPPSWSFSPETLQAAIVGGAVPLPSAIVTCELTGHYLDMSGNPLSGSVTFTPVITGDFEDSSDGVTLLPEPVVTQLDAEGRFTVTLPCTDNTIISPTGWAYAVEEILDGGHVSSYAISLPSTVGSPVNIAALAPINPPEPLSTLYGVLAEPNTWEGDNTFGEPVTLDGSPQLASPLAIGSGGTGATARVWAGLLTPVWPAVGTGASPYAAAAGQVVPTTTAGGNVTVNLPASPPDLTVAAVKQIAVGVGYATTVSGNGATFNGGAGTSLTLTLLNQGGVYQYDHSLNSWFVISDDVPLSQLDGRYVAKGTYAVSVMDYGATGNGFTDDTAAINAAIAALPANGGTVFFPAGNYKISSALNVLPVTVTGNMVFEGVNESGGSVITQSSTTADAITGANIKGFVMRNLRLVGPGSGSGHGIYLSQSAGNPTDYVDISDVRVIGFGSDGVKVDNPIVSHLHRVVVSGCGGNAFNINGGVGGAVGTSVVLEACYGLTCTAAGFQLTSLHYSTLISCAADACGSGYVLTSCQNVTLISPGAEQCTTAGYEISGGQEILLLNPYYNAQNETTSTTIIAYWVTGSAANVKLVCPTEGGLGSAQAGNTSIKVDSGSYCTVERPSVINAVSYAGTAAAITGVREVGDVNDRFYVDTNGVLRFGGGTGSTDIFFQRISGPALQASGGWQIVGPLTTTPAYQAHVTADTQQRWQVTAGGTMSFGPGNAATDTNLYRFAAGVLQTDNSLTVAGTLASPAFAPSGLTGATAASRYGGATTSGAPTSGTWAVGDFTVDRTGSFWICTTAGVAGAGAVFTQASGAASGTVDALGSLSGSQALATANGNYQTFTLANNVTITGITGPGGAVESSLTLYITQASSGGPYGVTWPGSVTWLGGAAPTIQAGASALTVVTLESLNGGTTWYGAQVTGAPALPVTIALGGTDATTQQLAIDNLAGTQTSGQVLRGDGTHVQMASLLPADLSAVKYAGVTGQPPRETIPFWGATGNITANAGVMFMAVLPVYPGDVITNVGFLVGSTPATFGTSGYHWWTALYDQSTNLLYQSADKTNTALPSPSAHMLPLSSAYSVPGAIYWLWAAVMINVGTGGSPVPPTIRGATLNAPTTDSTTSLFPTSQVYAATNGTSLGATAPAGPGLTLTATGNVAYIGAS